MGTQYNGIPDTIAPILPGEVLIASSTDTTPINVVTSSPHGLTTGDRVGIYGHTVNTNANGPHEAIVVNTTTIQLVGSTATGGGAGGGTGSVQPMTLGPTFVIPADGDPGAASTFDPGYEALGDRTALLAANIGSFRQPFVQQQPLAIDDNGSENSVWLNLTIPSSTADTWFPDTTSPLGGSVAVSKLLGLDVVTVTVTGTAVAVATTNLLIGLFCAFAPAGGVMGSPVKMSGSGRYIAAPGTTGFALQGIVRVPSGNSMAVYMAAWTSSSSAVGINFIGDASMIIRVDRPTDFRRQT